MKAVVLEGFGGVENLRLRDVPEPSAGPGQVVVRVRAVGLNYAEVLWRLTRSPRCQVPVILGWEIAGDVAEVGAGVTWPRPGHRVFGTTLGNGGNAEYALCDPASLYALPETVSYIDGASLPVVWGTVYHAVETLGRLAPDEVVLVHAAGGGVGTIAVQWAKALGARVVGTAGADAKLERVRALGCDVTVNYKTENLFEAVKAATEGVDLVLESIGGPVLTDSLKLLRPMGRLITFGYATGEWPQIDPYFLHLKNLTVSGLYFGRMKRELQVAGIEAGLRMLQSGQVKPVIGHRFALAEMGEAHALMERRASFGKIVIEP